MLESWILVGTDTIVFQPRAFSCTFAVHFRQGITHFIICFIHHLCSLPSQSFLVIISYDELHHDVFSFFRLCIASAMYNIYMNIYIYMRYIYIYILLGTNRIKNVKNHLGEL